VRTQPKKKRNNQKDGKIKNQNEKEEKQKL